MFPASNTLQPALELALLAAVPSGAAYEDAVRALMAARDRLAVPLLTDVGEGAVEPATDRARSQLLSSLHAAHRAVLETMPGPALAEQDNGGRIQRQA